MMYTKVNKFVKFFPKIITSKTVTEKHVTVILCRTTYFYDILILGETKYLRKIRKQYNSDSNIIKNGIFEQPCIIIDTMDYKGLNFFESIKNVLYARKRFKQVVKEIEKEEM